MTPRTAAQASVAIAVVVGIALAVLVWQEAGIVRRSTSATYDEMTYAKMAFAVRTGDFKPVTSKGVAPLPVLLDAIAIAPFRETDLVSPVLVRIIDRMRRVHVALVGLPLVIGVYLWLLRRRGWAVAGCAGALVAMSPTVIAHASLATTDAAVTLWSIVTLAALVWHEQHPGPRRLAIVALALGLACAAKYSAICLVPAVVLSVGWRRAAAAAAGAAIVVWALDGFLVIPLSDPEDYFRWLGTGPAAAQGTALARRVSLPGPLAGSLWQWMHQRRGQDAFFLGTSDSSGWWYYFPVAMALKSTPVELAIFVSLPLLLVATWTRRDRALTLWVVTLVSFAAVLLIGRVNIGVRYALPIYPLAVLCAADVLPLLRVRRWTVTAVAMLALAGQAFSSVAVAPHYLSYFNALAGGPAGGYRYLGDSNIDWGQDLPALADEIARLGHPRVCLAYFGSAPVTAYGISAGDWRDPPTCRDAEWLALSVTYLQGSYIDNDPFEALLSETPDRRAAYSIYLYDMRRPVVAAALEEALAPETH